MWHRLIKRRNLGVKGHHKKMLQSVNRLHWHFFFIESFSITDFDLNHEEKQMEIRDIEEELARDLFKTPTYARDIYSYLQVRGGSTMCGCWEGGCKPSWHFTSRCIWHTIIMIMIFQNWKIKNPTCISVFWYIHLTQLYSHPLTS